MKPEELADLGNLDDVQLLDVRLSDDFEAEHLAGALNNCVFEVAFVSQLSESAPDAKRATIVYGANAQSQEAETAAEKLRRQGYTDVRIMEGGLQAAREAGLDIILGKPLSPDPASPDGIYQIDLNESHLEWLGRNLLNKHWGTAALDILSLRTETSLAANSSWT